MLSMLCFLAVVSATTLSTATALDPSNNTNCGLFPGGDVVKDSENLQSFPGFGWDNLRNLPMAAVLDIYSYKTCRLTPDRKHIVPDFVDVVPVKKSSLDRFAQFYKDFREYYRANALSVNFQAGGALKSIGISGSYSHEYQETKRVSYLTEGSIMRTKLHHHAYSLIAEPDAPLEATFKQRIMEMGDAIRLNKTNLAKYLGQLLVRDYGTHIVTRVEAGSIVSQDDYVDNEQAHTALSDLETARAAASASFFNVVHLGFSIAKDLSTDTINQYNQLVKHSVIRAEGGPDFSTILTSSDWFNYSLSDLVALDRSGDPMFWYITNAQIPELPEPMVEHIQKIVQEEVQKYYDENTVPGCTDPKAPNFKYASNVDDGTCSHPFTNFTFGGVYQTCDIISGNSDSCDGLVIDNGEDGGTFCPDGYGPMTLINEVYSFPQWQQNCHWYWYRCWEVLWLWDGCKRWVCNSDMGTANVRLEAYWCNATHVVSQGSGYMFGGCYSDRRPNPFTQQQSCPGRFYSLTLGKDQESFSVCLSRDYELDSPYSIPFAGFVTCYYPNIQNCEKGYSKHLITTQNCETYYCTRTGALKDPGFPLVHRPPFMKMPYDTQALMAIYGYPDGRKWIWDDDNATWSAAQDSAMTTDDALEFWVANMNKSMTDGN